MFFVVLGLALIIMKYMEFGPVAMLSWLWVLSPLLLAVVWWRWADATGYSAKRAMERENLRKQKRIDANRESMGLATKSRKRK